MNQFFFFFFYFLVFWEWLCTFTYLRMTIIVMHISTFAFTLDCSVAGMSCIWHFLYKNKRTNLITSPKLPPVFKSQEGKERFGTYLSMCMHSFFDCLFCVPVHCLFCVIVLLCEEVLVQK